MKYILSIAFLSIIIACSNTKIATPSSIAITPANHYIVHPDVKLIDSITYMFITNEEVFHKHFHMTKASLETAIVPDFKSQSVVAVLYKPTTRIIDLHADKADIMNNDLNIYYTVNDTTTGSSYPQIIRMVAIVPKVEALRKVNFIANKVNAHTLQVER